MSHFPQAHQVRYFLLVTCDTDLIQLNDWITMKLWGKTQNMERNGGCHSM